MTTCAAQAANDNSARGATRTPSVEHFARSQQIGKLVNHLPMTVTTPSSTSSKPTEHAAHRRAVAERVAAEAMAGLPQLAARTNVAALADIVEQSLRTTVEQYKTAAAERGPEWMALYACPGWCVMVHDGKDGAPGWHQGPASKVYAPTSIGRGVPAAADVALTARINHTNSDADAFGTKTELWVDVDSETYQLDVAQADQFISELEQFLPRLRALREQLAEEVKSDRPRNEEAVALWDITFRARVAAIDAAKAGEVQ